MTADPPGRGCVECRQYALKACARGPALMYGSLIPYITGGHTFADYVAEGLTQNDVVTSWTGFSLRNRIVTGVVKHVFFRKLTGSEAVMGVLEK